MCAGRGCYKYIAKTRMFAGSNGSFCHFACQAPYACVDRQYAGTELEN